MTRLKPTREILEFQMYTFRSTLFFQPRDWAQNVGVVDEHYSLYEICFILFYVLYPFACHMSHDGCIFSLVSSPDLTLYLL